MGGKRFELEEVGLDGLDGLNDSIKMQFREAPKSISKQHRWVK